MGGLWVQGLPGQFEKETSLKTSKYKQIHTITFSLNSKVHLITRKPNVETEWFSVSLGAREVKLQLHEGHTPIRGSLSWRVSIGPWRYSSQVSQKHECVHYVCLLFPLLCKFSTDQRFLHYFLWISDIKKKKKQQTLFRNISWTVSIKILNYFKRDGSMVNTSDVHIYAHANTTHMCTLKEKDVQSIRHVHTYTRAHFVLRMWFCSRALV